MRESASLIAFPFVFLFERKLFTTSAVNPPADVKPPAISTALPMQNGHIGSSACPRRESPRTRRFRPLPYASVHVAPPCCDSFAVVVLNQPERRVPKLDQRPACHLAQAVLHIGNGWIGHKQWPTDFQERRPLDGLHDSPEMAVVVPQIAIPSAPRPRLDLHRHRFVIRGCVEGSELLQQRSERGLQRSAYVDFLRDVQRQIHVRAPLEATLAALLEQLGPFNAAADDKPMPMKIEPWPGGRWYRDLGDNNGHFWGVVQAIKRPTLLEISGPLFMSYPAVSNVQYRLSQVEGRTRTQYGDAALGRIQGDHGKGVTTGWGFMSAGVRKRAEAARSR